MGEPPDPAGMRAYEEELRATFLRMQEQAADLHGEALAVQVSEKSQDGMVTATVGARGDLIRLDLDPRIYRRPDARELANTITETVQRASTKAQEEIISIFESVIPEDQLRAHLEGDLESVLEQMGTQMRGED